MLHDPRTDFHYFTTPRQMASKQPGPWDRQLKGYQTVEVALYPGLPRVLSLAVCDKSLGRPGYKATVEKIIQHNNDLQPIHLYCDNMHKAKYYILVLQLFVFAHEAQ